MDLTKYVAAVEDYPQKGIIFRDITPLMADGEAFAYATQQIVDYAREVGAEVVVGPEARGFIVGCPVAYALKIGFIPVRKPGKLPRETIEQEYALEYGTDKLTMHKDDLKPGQKVLIIDDLLATGGTVRATIDLVEKLGAEVVGCAFLIELTDLNGAEKLKGVEYKTLMSF